MGVDGRHDGHQAFWVSDKFSVSRPGHVVQGLSVPVGLLPGSPRVLRSSMTRWCAARQLASASAATFARSVGLSPPHMPYGSFTTSACSRHLLTTGQTAHTAFAAASREGRLGPRSASGEKKLSGSTWRHLPSYCHSYSSISGLGSRAILAIGLTRTAHRKLADVEVAGAETRLAIGEVELPHAAECFIEALSANRLPVGVESVPPHAQGRRIVLAEFKAVVYAQLRVSGQRRIDRLDRGDEPAGEDVLLDPAIRIASGEVAVMLHQNGLNDHPATRRQQPVDRREIRRPILFADVF